MCGVFFLLICFCILSSLSYNENAFDKLDDANSNSMPLSNDVKKDDSNDINSKPVNEV